jgi:hypothetical protein
LSNELLQKENPSGDKPPKKARGGVASRKAKANSIAASAARSKGKLENQQLTARQSSPPHSEAPDDETPRTTTPSKVGDLSFVLNATSHSPTGATPSKSLNVQAANQQKDDTAPGASDPPPSFTPAEPAHNRIDPVIMLVYDGSACTDKETENARFIRL